MARIKLGKTKDSRTRKAAITEDAELEVLQKMLNEKEQPSFKKFLLQKGFSLQTIKSFETMVKRYHTWLQKENINEIAIRYNDIVHYIQYLKPNLKQRSVQCEINGIKHYYNYLKEIDLVKENPTLNVEIKGVKRKILYNVFDKQELEKLFDDYKNIASESPAKKRNEVILSLLIYQGLNTTELSRLTIEDIKLREGKVFINGTRRSNERTLKLEAHQILDIMEYTLQVRKELLQIKEKETNELFISISKGSNNVSNILRKLFQQLKKQNKKLTSVNQIRTSVITQWLKLYNLREVQYMAGHRYVSSTEAYFINDLEDLQEEIEKFHPIG